MNQKLLKSNLLYVYKINDVTIRKQGQGNQCRILGVKFEEKKLEETGK